jgi:isoleucyl-tRNA synthetase
MSKSAGNIVEPRDVIAQNGAEILRLWIAMLNFKEDAPFGKGIVQHLVEAYRKIRNTWRFLLGNLSDFRPDIDSLDPAEMEPFDRWALDRSDTVIRRILEAYDDYEFHAVFHAAYQFFTVDLSAFYLDTLKDRLYCSGNGSRPRRSAQTALFRILNDSLRLLAPLLPFTTEEAWEALPAFAGKEDSIHMAFFPEPEHPRLSEEEQKKWDGLLDLREQILKELEKAREAKLIGNALEARIVLRVPAARAGELQAEAEQLAILCIVSEVAVESSSEPDLGIRVEKAVGEKCKRCWNFSPSVGASAAHPDLCHRCEDVLEGQARGER